MRWGKRQTESDGESAAAAVGPQRMTETMEKERNGHLEGNLRLK